MTKHPMAVIIVCGVNMVACREHISITLLSILIIVECLFCLNACRCSMVLQLCVSPVVTYTQSIKSIICGYSLGEFNTVKEFYRIIFLYCLKTSAILSYVQVYE